MALKVGFELPEVHDLDKSYYLFALADLKFPLTDGTLGPPKTGIIDPIE